MASKVYFTDFTCKITDTMPKKLRRLVNKAGLGDIDFKNKYVAIKIHFGEYGNVGFVRHQYAKEICDYVKERGGIPFLTDANTLYPGFRNNAVKHLECAFLNGFNPLGTGVPTIIADGLRGTDERLIEPKGGHYVKEAKIASAIAEADIVIVITHCKGHVNAGFGGTLKNVGMGCGSKAGKKEMHSEGVPIVDKKCIGCGLCVQHCNNDGVHVIDGKAVVDEKKCTGCGYCIGYCPKEAINSDFEISKPLMNKKIAEYTKAVVQDKPAFYINFARDVSPFCDCTSSTDTQLVPNVGIYASYDPIAIDQASADGINKQPVFANGMAGKAAVENGCCEKDGFVDVEEQHDVFTMTHPDSDWEAGLEHGEKIGLGTREYELVKVK